MNEPWESLRLLKKADFAGPGVYVPTLLYSLLLNLVDNTVRADAPVLFRFLFVLIIHTTIYGFIKFARQYIFPSDEGGFQYLKVSIILLAAAVLRGYLMHYFSEGMDLYKIDNFLFREANSIQNIPVAFAVSGIATQAYREWQARRERLLVDNARLRKLIKSASVVARVEHQRLVDTVTGQLLRFVREIERSKPTEIIDNLRNGISTIVRPLSKEIDQHEFSEEAVEGSRVTISFRQVVTGIIHTRPLEPILMPLAVIWMGSPWVINNYGWERFGPFCLVVTLIGVTTYSLFQILIKYLDLNWVMAWVLVLAASVFSAIFERVAVEISLAKPLAETNLAAALLGFNLLWSTMFTLTGGIIRQLNLAEEDLKSTQTQLTWALARETEVQRQHSRSLAIALHGPVQTAVGASIIRLEQAALKGEISQDLITEVSELIYESLEQLQVGDQPIGLEQVCAELHETWSGICDIQNGCQPGVLEKLAEDPVASGLIGEIAPELAFNAIKHGNATKVDISVNEPAANAVTLTIIDNGTQFVQSNESTGLGMKHLRESALEVRRHFVEGKNKTEIVLPFQVSGKP